MLGASQVLFAIAFAGYLLSAIVYIARLGRLRRPAAVPVRLQAAVGAAAPLTAGSGDISITTGPGSDRGARWAGQAMVTAVLLHGIAIGLRWTVSGQAPMSNMYEYMSLTGWAAMLFFVFMNLRYNLPALGAFVAPVGLLVIAYASVFPSQVQPLVAPLRSYWLVLHVTLAALGEGAFAVAFAAALMYLLRIYRDGQLSLREQTVLEALFGATAVLIGFVATALAFKAAGYEIAVPDPSGGLLSYNLPPFAAPMGVPAGSLGSFAGLPLPLVAAPDWMGGVAAGRKLNTLVISLTAGAVIYWLVRLAARQPWREFTSRAVASLDPDVLDDLSYRAVAIGFPLFTLGAMVFAMIWAQKAWGRYWSWDPKETWSLISWLFYAGYLHMRIVRGWDGRLAAWAAAAGFVVILFTLVGVNLLISGLHSYAGG